MKHVLIRPLMIGLAVWSAVLATGCASGGFKLTRQYAQFVNRQQLILRIVLYILTSIVFAATLLIDAVIFNTMAGNDRNSQLKPGVLNRRFQCFTGTQNRIAGGPVPEGVNNRSFLRPRMGRARQFGVENGSVFRAWVTERSAIKADVFAVVPGLHQSDPAVRPYHVIDKVMHFGGGRAGTEEIKRHRLALWIVGQRKSNARLNLAVLQVVSERRHAACLAVRHPLRQPAWPWNTCGHASA